MFEENSDQRKPKKESFDEKIEELSENAIWR